ncbi:hypothetical protein STEG23_025138 [Scotinomys teguina]
MTSSSLKSPAEMPRCGKGEHQDSATIKMLHHKKGQKLEENGTGLDKQRETGKKNGCSVELSGHGVCSRDLPVLPTYDGVCSRDLPVLPAYDGNCSLDLPVLPAYDGVCP